MRAVCRIRPQPHYRREAFVHGLQRAGYLIAETTRPSGPDDVLVSWNSYGYGEHEADEWRRAGGRVIVAENGYIGRDAEGRQLYALANEAHNGAGRWPEGGPERFAALGVDLQPWRAAGDHLLVCGQRGIGSKTMASPPNWHDHAARALARMTDRPIRVRPHPGSRPADKPLAEELAGAWACVIWSSGAGVQALAAGVPVLFDAPAWIGSSAAARIAPETVAAPQCDDAARLDAFRRLAWAQWTVAEIETGEPFVRLREC